MSNAPSLSLFAPEIRLASVQTLEDRSSWPQLARLAGRGSIEAVRNAHESSAPDLRAWQEALLQTLGLSHASAHYASAPLVKLGGSPERTAEFWMHVEPVHLAAGLDRLTLVPWQEHTQVRMEERARLADTIGSHVREQSLRFEVAADGQWLMAAPRMLDVQTIDLEVAVERELDAAMPRGRDAGELRRLMTELQMLLHEHPVNQARARAGVPPINAVWISGAGALDPPASISALPAAFGADLYLRGLYRLHGGEVGTLPRNAEALLSELSASANYVVVADARDLDALEEHWIAPLVHALARGKLGRLEIVVANRRVSASRGGIRRFWRKASPPAEWVH
jgi:hypothetical protein